MMSKSIIVPWKNTAQQISPLKLILYIKFFTITRIKEIKLQTGYTIKDINQWFTNISKTIQHLNQIKIRITNSKHIIYWIIREHLYSINKLLTTNLLSITIIINNQQWQRTISDHQPIINNIIIRHTNSLDLSPVFFLC